MAAEATIAVVVLVVAETAAVLDLPVELHREPVEAVGDLGPGAPLQFRGQPPHYARAQLIAAVPAAAASECADAASMLAA